MTTTMSATRDGLELRVGHVDEGDAELLLHAAQLAAHAQAQILVERRQRLVEQQHARIGDQRARERHALLLAAGELGRQAVGELLQLHLASSSRALPWRSALPAPRIFSAEGDVVEHAAMREQRIALEHHGRAALHRRQRR